MTNARINDEGQMPKRGLRAFCVTLAITSCFDILWRSVADRGRTQGLHDHLILPASFGNANVSTEHN